MEHQVRLLKHHGAELGLLLDMRAYLDLKRRHGLTYGALADAARDLDQDVAPVVLLEAVAGHRRLHPPAEGTKPYTRADADALVYAYGLSEIWTEVLTPHIVETGRRRKKPEKGEDGEDGGKGLPTG